MRSGGDNFLVSLGIMLFGVGPFSEAVNYLFLVGCEVVVDELVDFGVLDSSFWGCLKLCAVKEWASGRVVNMVDVASGFFGMCLGGITEVHILNFFVGIDFKELFNSFRG